MVYRQFIMIPVVLIDATNYVNKCITTQATSIQIWVSFNIAFLCKKIRFSVPPLLPRLLTSNVILCDQYLLYVFMYSCVYNGASQPCFSLCMVDCTLKTDQMTTSLFSISYGVMYREAEFATNIQRGKDL